MRSLDWYLTEATTRAKLTSDRQLALALKLDGSVVHQMKKRGMLPADATMLRLAELAGVDATEALLDLNQWRTKDPASRAVYERIASIIAKTAAALLLIVGIAGTQPAQADTKARDHCILWKIKRRWFAGLFARPACAA